MKSNDATLFDSPSSNQPPSIAVSLYAVIGPLAPHPISDFFAVDFDPFSDPGSPDLNRCLLSRPVVLYQGMVLHGGGRMRAAFARGVSPSFEHYNGDEPLAYVLSLAFDGPNYSKGQRAAGVAYLQDWSVAQTHGGMRTQVAKLQLDTCKNRARRAGVCPRYQSGADKVAKADTNLLVKVFRGAISLADALKMLEKPAISKPAGKRDLHEQCKADLADLRARLEASNASSELIGRSSTASSLDMGAPAEIDRLRQTLAQRDAKIASLTARLMDAERQARRGLGGAAATGLGLTRSGPPTDLVRGVGTSPSD